MGQGFALALSIIPIAVGICKPPNQVVNIDIEEQKTQAALSSP